MTDICTDELAEKMTSFKRLLDNEQISKAESLQKDMAISRRITHHTLTKDAEELFKMAEDNTEAAEKLFSLVNEYISDLKFFLELATSSSTRLLSALACIEDQKKYRSLMDEWAIAVDAPKH